MELHAPTHRLLVNTSKNDLRWEDNRNSQHRFVPLIKGLRQRVEFCVQGGCKGRDEIPRLLLGATANIDWMIGIWVRPSNGHLTPHTSSFFSLVDLYVIAEQGTKVMMTSENRNRWLLQMISIPKLRELYLRPQGFPTGNGRKSPGDGTQASRLRWAVELELISLILGFGVTFFSSRLILEQVSRNLLRNNSQIVNQRRAMTTDVLRYLPTPEAMTTKGLKCPRKKTILGKSWLKEWREKGATACEFLVFHCPDFLFS